MRGRRWSCHPLILRARGLRFDLRRRRGHGARRRRPDGGCRSRYAVLWRDCRLRGRSSHRSGRLNLALIRRLRLHRRSWWSGGFGSRLSKRNRRPELRLRWLRLDCLGLRDRCGNGPILFQRPRLRPDKRQAAPFAAGCHVKIDRLALWAYDRQSIHLLGINEDGDNGWHVCQGAFERYASVFHLDMLSEDSSIYFTE